MLDQVSNGIFTVLTFHIYFTASHWLDTSNTLNTEQNFFFKTGLLFWIKSGNILLPIIALFKFFKVKVIVLVCASIKVLYLYIFLACV